MHHVFTHPNADAFVASCSPSLGRSTASVLCGVNLNPLESSHSVMFCNACCDTTPTQYPILDMDW